MVNINISNNNIMETTLKQENETLLRIIYDTAEPTELEGIDPNADEETLNREYRRIILETGEPTALDNMNLY